MTFPQELDREISIGLRRIKFGRYVPGFAVQVKRFVAEEIVGRAAEVAKIAIETSDRKSVV